MAGAHGSASRWQRRRREVVEEGRSRKIGVGMVLSMGAKLCCGTCMDTGGDATPKHLPVSHSCSQDKQGKTSLKAELIPHAPAQTLACTQM